MKKIFKESSLLFLIGSILYPLIEILWRKKTHISMAILGGLCLAAIRLVDRALGKGKFMQKALCSSILITQFEFLCGVIVNLGMGLDIWDYSANPLNLLGQICLLFSFFWFLISLPPLWFFHWYERKTEKKNIKKLPI